MSPQGERSPAATSPGTDRGVVVLDNEAVQALLDIGHPKHRRVLSHLAAVAERRKKGDAVRVVVPTSVRVEACWNTRARSSAIANGIPTTDHVLDRAAAERAVIRRLATNVSVVDAHVGVAADDAASRSASVTVLTSDPDDIRAATSAGSVRIIRL